LAPAVVAPTASIVVISDVPTLSIEVIHERTGSPSTCTVQAPQSANTAAKFRAGHAEHVTEHPQQRCVAVDINAVTVSVDFDDQGHVRLHTVDTHGDAHDTRPFANIK
jgi:hypothetical protein